MPELLVHLPDDLFERLRREAEARRATPEEVALAALRQALAPTPDLAGSEGERLERFIRESGLFAPPERKLGPELEKLARDLSPEERERLAEALSRGKSLSEMIIEDRG